MNVLIKGLKMPRSCQECPCEQCYVNNYGHVICRECSLLYKGYTTAFDNERREDCPLIEIPPHGRLIDADDLDNHILGHVDTRDCPTIIPADVPDNNVGNIPAEEGTE